MLEKNQRVKKTLSLTGGKLTPKVGGDKFTLNMLKYG